MEQNQSSSLFGLSIDPTTKAHLTETARWAKFLAICGFIMLALMIVYGIVITTVMSATMGAMENEFGGYYQQSSLTAGMTTFMIVIFIVVALIYFFPILFTLRFANKMKIALNNNDQDALNESFMNLKITLRYLGILTIICLALMLLSILAALAGTMMVP